MKQRQFITILTVIIVGFIYFGYRIDKMQDYITNIDNNVATIDERIAWDLQPKTDYLYDNN